MGLASVLRVLSFAAILGLGNRFGTRGATLGAVAFMVGLIVEAVLVCGWAHSEEIPSRAPSALLPHGLSGVARYYAPLALTMLLMWGGRAALVAVLARASDKDLALAAWAASWGFVILVANLTRMVQQLVIKYAHEVPVSRLVALGGWSGLASTLIVVALGHTDAGRVTMALLLGQDDTLGRAAQAVIALSVGIPLLVAMQNVLQGYCIVANRNRWINGAGLVGVVVTLGVALAGVLQGFPGANVGAAAITIGLIVEVVVLALLKPWNLKPGCSN